MPPRTAKHTTQLLIPWLTLAILGMPGVLLLVLGLSGLGEQTLLSQTLVLQRQQPVTLSAVLLSPQTIGGYRVTCLAKVGAEQIAQYEVRLRDQRQQVIAAAMAEARQVMVYVPDNSDFEDWLDRDLHTAIDLRVQRRESITLEVVLIELMDSEGDTLPQPLNLTVQVQQGVVDTRYLWIGLVLSSGVAALTLYLAIRSSKTLINSDPFSAEFSRPLHMGGPRELIQVQVTVTTNTIEVIQAAELLLQVMDARQTLIYQTKIPLSGLQKRGYQYRVSRFWILTVPQRYQVRASMSNRSSTWPAAVKLMTSKMPLTPMTVTTISPEHKTPKSQNPESQNDVA
jgi:hypothetical protein